MTLSIKNTNILDAVSEGIYFLDPEGKITYWSKGAERITGYKTDDALGGRLCSDILKHVDSRGVQLCNTPRCPSYQTLRCGITIQDTVFFQHKFGHRVPVTSKSFPLRDERGEVVGSAQVFTDSVEESTLREKLTEYEKLALLDPLTEIGNRRLGELQIKSLFNELQRYGSRFGIAYIDIDNFKNFNDRYGHDIGDLVLVTVARTLASNTRTFDFVLRWGGEEFISVIKNVDENNLSNIANKLRTMVEHSAFSLPGAKDKVTVSIGATLSRPGDTVDTLLKRADALMYQSKEHGRNRVTLG